MLISQNFQIEKSLLKTNTLKTRLNEKQIHQKHEKKEKLEFT